MGPLSSTSQAASMRLIKTTQKFLIFKPDFFHTPILNSGTEQKQHKDTAAHVFQVLFN